MRNFLRGFFGFHLVLNYRTNMKRRLKWREKRSAKITISSLGIQVNFDAQRDVHCRKYYASTIELTVNDVITMVATDKELAMEIQKQKDKDSEMILVFFFRFRFGFWWVSRCFSFFHFYIRAGTVSNEKWKRDSMRRSNCKERECYAYLVFCHLWTLAMMWHLNDIRKAGTKTILYNVMLSFGSSFTASFCSMWSKWILWKHRLDGCGVG